MAKPSKPTPPGAARFRGRCRGVRRLQYLRVLGGLSSNGALRFRLVGSDLLDGGSGADTLRGGVGNDVYIVDNSGDTVEEAPNAGHDLVRSSVSYALADNVEDLNLTGTADSDATGNAGQNQLVGNNGANRLDGGQGWTAWWAAWVTTAMWWRTPATSPGKTPLPASTASKVRSPGPSRPTPRT
ncbi:MAG: calcium-binding protein [Sulfuritalea sp.]|nr:calcium-binding protein [Sulfuritalea sp.]